jgi:hypothetical protein
MKREKGDILKGSKRRRDEAYHRIIFLDGKDDDSFIGAVLTHDNRHKDNILMKENHFIKNRSYKFSFDNKNGTYLVSKKFIKLEDWGPFEKAGKLTESGIKFVDLIVGNLDSVLWIDYIKKQKYG